MTHKYKRLFTLAQISIIVFFRFIPQVKALTINGVFKGAGESVDTPIGQIPLEDQPTNTTGSGNLVDIFNAAASMWENVLLDDHTVNIEYGWLNLENFGEAPDRTGAAPTWDSSFPATTSFVVINNNNQTPFFLDATPELNEEYTTFRSTNQDFGAGELNTGRVLENPVGEAVGQVDIFSVVLTQIGVSLGFFIPDPPFAIPGNPNFTFPSITVDSPLPFAGSDLPTIDIDGGRIDLPDVVISPNVEFGQRKLLSTADVLAVAEVTGFTQVDLSSTQVPENSSILSLSLMGGMIIGSKWLRFFNNKINTKKNHGKNNR